jgi:hypothetical protein
VDKSGCAEMSSSCDSAEFCENCHKKATTLEIRFDEKLRVIEINYKIINIKDL